MKTISRLLVILFALYLLVTLSWSVPASWMVEIILIGSGIAVWAVARWGRIRGIRRELNQRRAMYRAQRAL